MYFYNGVYSIVWLCNGYWDINMYIYFVKFKNFYYYLRYFYFRCKGCRLWFFKMVSKYIVEIFFFKINGMFYLFFVMWLISILIMW